jgi:hypothetical protein
VNPPLGIVKPSGGAESDELAEFFSVRDWFAGYLRWRLGV